MSAKIYLPKNLLIELYKYRNLSMDKESEYCGKFVVRKNRLQMFPSVQQGKVELAHGGSATKKWSGCSLPGNAYFTWHTHPIEYNKRGNVQNVPFIPSPEDVVGYVQDSLFNNMFLSNPNGKLIYDFLVTPAGVLAIGAGAKALELWKKLSSTSTKKDRQEWISATDTKGKKAVQWMQMSEPELRRHIKAQAFAEVENAYNHDRFMSEYGGFGFEDTLWDKLEEDYGYGGFAQKESNGDVNWNFAEKPKAQTLKWFRSPAFLKQNMLQVDPYYKGAVEYLRNKMGLTVHYIPWGAMQTRAPTEIAIPLPDIKRRYFGQDKKPTSKYHQLIAREMKKYKTKAKSAQENRKRLANAAKRVSTQLKTKK